MNWWRRNVERHGHWVVAVAATTCHHFVFPKLYPTECKELIGAVVNISGIAIGFLATGQALLCSLSDNFVVNLLKKLHKYDGMLRLFSIAIRWCLALAVFSLLSYWLDFKGQSFFFSVWLGMFAGAFAATVRILVLFNEVLHGKSNSKPTKGPLPPAPKVE